MAVSFEQKEAVIESLEGNDSLSFIENLAVGKIYDDSTYSRSLINNLIKKNLLDEKECQVELDRLNVIIPKCEKILGCC